MTISALSEPKKDAIKVLVADDSGAVLGLMARMLNADSSLEVVAKARNGKKAVEMYKEHNPDFAILDVVMPEMGGIDALIEIKKFDSDAQVFICSAVTKKDAEEVLNAVTEHGAIDFIKKPVGADEVAEFIDGLKVRMQQIGKHRGSNRSKMHDISKVNIVEQAPEVEKFATRPYPMLMLMPKIIAIGSSTGGPQALMEVLKPLKGKVNVPIVVTQHMPASFTEIFSKQLADTTGMEVREACDSEILKPGIVYIAPGDYHMRFKKTQSDDVQVVLGQDEEVNFCRPAVDPMFESVLDVYTNNILSVILTGMGSDGCEGAKKVVSGGNNLLISQDKETSVVWGMPAAVAKEGLPHEILPLTQIPHKILTIFGQ